jgi:hypothetical protein
MFAADAGDDSAPRPDHFDKGAKLAGMIGANFEYGGLVSGFKIQKRERNSNVIIKAGLTAKRIEFLTEDRSEQVLGAGLAVRASHGDHFRFEKPAISGSELSEGRASVIDHEAGTASREDSHAVFFDEGRDGSGPKDLVQKYVSIKILADEGDEQITG